MKTPLISVIIPTLDEEKRIAKCLDSIRKQKYPKNKVEIILVDDGSSDTTLKIAARYHVKVFKNGTHHIERGKSIGLSKAKGEYIFFIDADNFLTNMHWFKVCVEIFQRHKEVAGIEAWRLKYHKKDSLMNRYCELFGVTDPMIFYLRRKGWLMQPEDWKKSKYFEEDFKDYYIDKYDVQNLPTIGSNGYMVRKSLLKKTDWKPYLFHLDSTYDLVKMGYSHFARVKFDIGHDYAESVGSAVKKIKRNLGLYFKYEKIRRYKYNMSFPKVLTTFFIMSTVLIPIIDSARGYLRKPDIAWFLNPILSFIYVWMYVLYTIKNKALLSVRK